MTIIFLIHRTKCGVLVINLKKKLTSIAKDHDNIYIYIYIYVVLLYIFIFFINFLFQFVAVIGIGKTIITRVILFGPGVGLFELI
jgi:hypothetical protein